MRIEEPPRIYVTETPATDVEYIPADAVELTTGIDGYMVNSSIAGLARPDAEITHNKFAGANASRISGRQIAARNIVFEIIPLPPFAQNRERLYNILPFGKSLRFYFEKAGKIVFTDGEVEKLGGEMSPEKPFRFSLSVLCPFPWFQSLELHSMKLKAGDNIVYNRGDIPAGFRWYVEPVANKVRAYEIKLTAGGETFATKPDKAIVAATELITVPGKKYFHCVTNSVSSQERPAFSLLTANSAWPQIPAGEQTVTLTYTNDSPAGYTYDDMNTLYWRDTFSGV